MTKKKLKQLIDDNDIVGLFDTLDDLEINEPQLNNLKKTFIAGKADQDFYDKLKVYVSTLDLPAPTLTPVVRELRTRSEFSPTLLQNLMDKLPADIPSQLDEMSDYDRKLFIAKFKELQDQVNKKLNKFFAHDIFETIITPNVLLSEVDKNKLYAMSSSNFKEEHITWVEKCMIVSALSISFINKYDALRLDLLLSFVFGYEEKVWQRALVGLMLGLLQRDKIAKGDKNTYAKFEQIKDLAHVQEAIYHISIALETERYKKREVPDFFKEEQNSEFFQKAQHWFLPFDEKSTWVQEAMDKAIQKHNFDYLAFQDTLAKTVGTTDTEKYALCFSLLRLSEKELAQKIKGIEDFYKQQIEAKAEETWVYSRFLQNILTDLYRFHLLYPKANLRKIFEEQISIAQTSLIDLLAAPQNKGKIEIDRWEEIGKVCVDEDKDYDAAIKTLQKAVQLKPQSANNWNYLAYANFFTKQYEKAIMFYEKAIEIEPEDYASWNNLGNAYFKLKNYDKAVESYEKALEIKPDNDSAWFNLGIAYDDLKNYEKAVECYEKALEIKPDNDSAWFNLGIAYDDLKNYEKAVECYQKAIEIKPDYDSAWNNLGIAYDDLKNYEKAVESYEKALEIKPDNDSAWFNLGIAYKNLKNHEKVIECYQKAIEINPNKAGYWNNLGIAFFNLKSYEKAIEKYQKAIEFKHDYHEAWYNLGLTYFNLRNYEKAIESYYKAIEFEPNYYEVWYNLGVVYNDLKNYEKAIESYQKAIEIKSDNDEVWYNLGNIYVKLEEYDKAKEAYSKIVVKDESLKDLGTDVYFVIQFVDLEKFDEALELIGQLATRKHNNDYVWVLFAGVYSEQKQYIKALECLQKAYAINPKGEITVRGFAFTYSLLENKTQALYYLQEVFILNPEWKQDAKTETDFAWLWEDEDFKALVADVS